jgi:hypothetical protein
VAHVVVAGIVPVEHPDEAPEHPNLGLVRVGVLLPRLVVPALEPEQHDGEQVAAQLSGLGPRGALQLVVQRPQQRLELVGSVGGHRDDAPAAPAKEPPRG